MANSTAPNTAQVVLGYSLHGQYLENVLNFLVPDPLSEAKLQNLAGAVRDWYGAEMAINFSSALSLNSITVKSLDLALPFEWEEPSGLPILGGQVGEAASVNVAALTAFKTGLIGRSNRGRVYQSGITENETSGNTFVALRVAAIQAAWIALPAALETGYFHVVLSRIQGGIQIDPAEVNDVTTYTTDFRVHDMGRRLDN